MTSDKNCIVTIDGPVGSGKSTIGRLLARRLGFVYLDTGAMYRAVGLEARSQGIDPEDDSALGALCRQMHISFRNDDDRQIVLANGRDITDEIRLPEVSMLASRVSAQPSVRKALVAMQQQIGQNGGIVADGRDAGTVIFPDARHKFFIDASVKVRTDRRYKELIEKKIEVDYNALFNDIEKRDYNDRTRSHSPLKPAADAVTIDTSSMTIEDVLAALLAEIERENMLHCHK